MPPLLDPIINPFYNPLPFPVKEPRPFAHDRFEAPDARHERRLVDVEMIVVMPDTRVRPKAHIGRDAAAVLRRAGAGVPEPVLNFVRHGPDWLTARTLPQLVAAMHSLVGLAAVFIGLNAQIELGRVVRARR